MIIHTDDFLALKKKYEGRVQEIDFSKVSNDKNGKLKIYWKNIDRYKRFLILKCLFPDQVLIPTEEVDRMWHDHILHTVIYTADCARLTGEYIHHNPNITGHDTWALFLETVLLYKSVFGDDMVPCDSQSAKCG